MSCCSSWFSLFISMLCSSGLVGDGDFEALFRSWVRSAGDGALFLLVVGLELFFTSFSKRP